MNDSPFRARRLRPDEVRRVLRRAAELAEHDPATRAAEQALTEDELRALASNLGLPESAVEQALVQQSPPDVAKPKGGFLGAPMRSLLEEELAGELSPELHEDIVDAIQVVLGDAGTVQVVGRTLTWTPTITPANPPRQLSISIRSRDGKTRLRIDEKHTNLAAGLFFGLGFGLGLGAGAPLIAILAAVYKAPLVGVVSALVTLTLVFLLARAIFAEVGRRRAQQHEDLMRRLRAVVRSSPPARRVAVAEAEAAPARARVAVRSSEFDEAEAEAEAEMDVAKKDRSRSIG